MHPAELPPALRRALDEAQKPVRFWWRDDDAGRDNPALDGLLDLAADLDLPLVLAVVPAWLHDATVERIARHRNVAVFQHGWAHVDHARRGQRKIELGGDASLPQLGERLEHGRLLLEERFAAQFYPAMVPPWNRIDPGVAALLPRLRFKALSAMAASRSAPLSMLLRCDVHLDVMTWQPAAGMLSLDEIAGKLAMQIKTRPDEAIGLMTHHQVTDAEGMHLLSRFFKALRVYPGACFLAASDLLGG